MREYVVVYSDLNLTPKSRLVNRHFTKYASCLCLASCECSYRSWLFPTCTHTTHTNTLYPHAYQREFVVIWFLVRTFCLLTDIFMIWLMEGVGGPPPTGIRLVVYKAICFLHNFAPIAQGSVFVDQQCQVLEVIKGKSPCFFWSEPASTPPQGTKPVLYWLEKNRNSSSFCEN